MRNVLTTHEAAEVLGLRYDTLRQYLHRGVIDLEPIGVFGKAKVWDRDQVEALARKRAAQ